MSRPRIYSLMIRCDLSLLFDPAQAMCLLKDQLPNRLPRLKIPHMLVATPAEILVAENLLRKKRKLPETQEPSPCWNFLLTNAEKKPLVQVLLWFWEFLFGDFALD